MGICKRLFSMQENANVILPLSSSYHIDTSTRSKNLKQTLLQEIDMAMMDNQVRNHFVRIALYMTFKSAVSPS
jgi:hypothetical protein